MLDNNAYIEFLMTHIKPFARLTGGRKEINCRCYYCSDSDNMKHGHFYINVDLSNNKPSYFYCQKCHSTGIVTSQKLIEWGLYDANLALDITKYNKYVLDLPQNMMYKDKEVYHLKRDHITVDKLSQYKVDYINNRLGINISYQDCIDRKIILNLKDILDKNNLQYTRHPNVIDQLDANFLGFLSYDNAFINMRNLGLSKELLTSIDKRYVNYNIFNKYDNTTKFYISPNSIDILKPIRVHIAEGPFDILSILYNLNEGNIGNDVYAAATGSSYLGILKFIVLNLKLMNIEVHFYPDNDISNSKIYRIIELSKLLYTKFFIHRNMYPGEKDFGVRKENIKESILEV